MHRDKHLFEQVCSFDNLYAASREALKGKRSKLPFNASSGSVSPKFLEHAPIVLLALGVAGVLGRRRR